MKGFIRHLYAYKILFQPHSPESLPPRSHTPGGSLTSPGQQNHAALYPTSPTPATGKTPPPPARGLADDDLMCVEYQYTIFLKNTIATDCQKSFEVSRCLKSALNRPIT